MWEALIILVVLGIVFYLVENLVPMSEPFKLGVRVIAALIVLIVILNLLGFTSIPLTPPQFRR